MSPGQPQWGSCVPLSHLLVSSRVVKALTAAWEVCGMRPWLPASLGTVSPQDHRVLPEAPTASCGLWHQALTLQDPCIPISPVVVDDICFIHAFSTYSTSARSEVPSVATSLLIPFGWNEGAHLGTQSFHRKPSLTALWLLSFVLQQTDSACYKFHIFSLKWLAQCPVHKGHSSINVCSMSEWINT